MNRNQRKKVFDKMLGEELIRRPELKKGQLLYKRTRLIWLVFSVIYTVVTLFLLVYTKKEALIMASVMVPVAALLCIYFLNGGMKNIIYITFFAGLFELFRGYVLIRFFESATGRMAFTYVICVLIQGIVTMGISLFILLSTKMGPYLSAVKRINREIDLGRY